MTNTHRAVIENSCPPSLTVIAAGPRDHCYAALADWVGTHPLDEFDTPRVLLVEAPAHEFTGTVKRADGVTITATITVPDGHALTLDRARPWHVTGRTNQNFLEVGELAMMIAQHGYSVVERNERHREEWTRRDYWADLLDVDPPTPAIEPTKDDDLCECSESYRHRGEHTPGCPADDGERGPLDES